MTQQNPQHRPVVVIDNFLHKADNASVIYDNITKWATLLIEANVAHVIFLTNEVGYSKALASDRVLRTITLSDKDPEMAKLYVLRQLEYVENERRKQWGGVGGRYTASETTGKERDLNLDNCIRVLGGRLKDLEGLVQRLAMGVSPDGLSFSSLTYLRCIERYHRAGGVGNPQIIFPGRFSSNQMDSSTGLDISQTSLC